MVIDDLPKGLAPQVTASGERDPWARNETCFNASNTRFAAAFNIVEATMMNEMGHLVWGRINNRRAVISGRMKGIPVYCWGTPFARWLGSRCFVVKVAPRASSHPLVAIHFDKGFQILRGSSHLKSRPEDIDQSHLGRDWLGTEEALIRAMAV